MEATSNPGKEKSRKRLREILHVLRKNDIVRGLDPDKLARILEDLGPTFIKVGQMLSTHSDILPKPYVDALKKLQSQVDPAPYEEVAEQIEEAYGQPIGEVFSFFDHEALGSASIAQVHEARFMDGTDVVVKVERPYIYDMMGRDIMLLKKACRLLKYTSVNEIVDLQGVLDEMWRVAQQEMDFLQEADNIERFREENKDVAYISCPIVYRELSTRNILVMENIIGPDVDDTKSLEDEGYDLSEIAAKLADNYVKQVIDDGYFHADPHPGNIKIRDGKIVYFDMGMMGTLSETERKLVGDIVAGVAGDDVPACVNAVLGLGIFHRRPDRRKLHRDIETLIDSYGKKGLGDLEISKIFEDMFDIMKDNGVEIPSSLVMLMRGLSTLEGVVSDLDPNVNIVGILGNRVSASLLRDLDLGETVKKDALAIWKGVRKTIEMPTLVSNVLESILKDETYIGMEHHASEDLKALLRELTGKIIVVLASAALFIGAGAAWSNDGISIMSIAMASLAVAFLVGGYIRYRRKDDAEKEQKRKKKHLHGSHS